VLICVLVLRQHANRIFPASYYLSFLACKILLYSSTLSHEQQGFAKKKKKKKMFFFFFFFCFFFWGGGGGGVSKLCVCFWILGDYAVVQGRMRRLPFAIVASPIGRNNQRPYEINYGMWKKYGSRRAKSVNQVISSIICHQQNLFGLRNCCVWRVLTSLAEIVYFWVLLQSGSDKLENVWKEAVVS